MGDPLSETERPEGDEPSPDASAEAPAGPPDAEAAPAKSKKPDEPAPASAPAKPAREWKPAGAMRPRVAYALAAMTGLLYFVGFPGIDLWPVSFVALVPLILALQNQPPRRAAGLGWMAGFVMTMTGFYWLLDMLRVFSGFGTPLCLLFMSILCAYQGGRIALAGWLYGRAAARGWPAAPVFALAFATSELVYPLLFPWYFGASVHNAPVLMQVADIGGPILVGLVLVAANLGIAEAAGALLGRRALDRRLVAIGAIVPLVATLYGLWRMSSVDRAAAASEEVKIGIVQPNLPLFNRKASNPMHARMTKELRERGVDLVVWSEAAIQGSFLEPAYGEDVEKKLTRNIGVPTIAGVVLRRPAQPGGGAGARSQYFNTALMATAEGKIVGRYDKQYLLMFGEYLPFGDVFPILYEWSPNSGRFTPGTSIDALPAGDHKISALICYEDILPSFVNRVVRHAQPDLLVNLTNDAWFGDSTEPWIHLALAKLRAVEHRRYLVRATNSGVSAIVDPVGRPVLTSGTFTTEALVGVARWMRATTPFEVLGDIPWYAAAIVTFAMAIWSKPKRRAG